MSWVCQQCKEPLQLDASLVDLAPSAHDTIVAALPNLHGGKVPSDAEKWDKLPASPTVKSVYQKAKSSKASSSLSSRASKQPKASSPLPNESFVLLQDSIIQDAPPPSPQRSKRNSQKTRNKVLSPTAADPSNPAPVSERLRSTAQLFNLLSTRTEIDHPLCAECVQILLNSLQKQLEETKKERDGYIAFEKEVRKERDREAQGPSKEDMEKKIEKLKNDEASAIQQLKDAEREREQLDDELKHLEEEEKALELEEAEFWRAHNEHVLAVDQQEARLASLRAAYAADSATLDKLERTNVYNDAFCIGHDGSSFGTINGLRLGRVPGTLVEWAEINAAWGQTLLLLYTIARKLDYTFENYRLIPMGSFSRIEKTTGDKASYELYGSGDLAFGRLLHNRRFDHGMAAFLDCLKQLMDHIKAQDTTVEFPHQVVKDKIGDVSIKLQFNQEESWTRALRHVLLALKICLKWATNGSSG